MPVVSLDMLEISWFLHKMFVDIYINAFINQTGLFTKGLLHLLVIPNKFLYTL